MSRTESQERNAVYALTNAKHSAAYRAARRANIPVTIVEGTIIYRVSRDGKEKVGVVAAPIKIDQQVYDLK